MNTLRPESEPTIETASAPRTWKLRIRAAGAAARRRVVALARASWRGAAIGALAGMAVNLVIMNTHFVTGLPRIVDFLLALLTFGLIWLLGALAKAIFRLVRCFEPSFVAAMAATLLFAYLLPIRAFSFPLVVLELACGALAGFSFTRGWKKPLSLALLSLAAAANVYLVVLLAREGFDRTPPVTDAWWTQPAGPGLAVDPSRPGSFTVQQLCYGSGTDLRRPEYGAAVALKTKPVDATPFFDQRDGFMNTMRRLYWGFDSTRYPLNARVWYPDGPGPFPLVLIVHGNHAMTDFSDPGYEYLGRLLASRGFIFVSVDENFLNGSWSGDYNQAEVFTRGLLLLKLLEAWRAWNAAAGTPFTGKVALDRVVVMGHSRGGAAAAVAAVVNRLPRYHLDAKQSFKFQFGIRGVVQLAPNDPYYPQTAVPLRLENVNYLILQGGWDQDMSFFMGNRFYNRLRFTDGAFHFKSALFIYRANHGQFNTVWGRKELGRPFDWLLNLRPILPAEDQRQVACLYLSAFVEASLHNRAELLPLFQDFRCGRTFLPRDYYLSQYEDSTCRYLADFEEDLDATTGSRPGVTLAGRHLATWSENALPLRDEDGLSQHNLGVYLGWDKPDAKKKRQGPAEYVLRLAPEAREGLPLGPGDDFILSLCNNQNDPAPVDFHLYFYAAGRQVRLPLGRFRQLPPPLKTELTKCPRIFAIAGDKPVERVLQTVVVPLAELVKADPAFAPDRIEEIRLVFDQTAAGEIFLDRVGFRPGR